MSDFSHQEPPIDTSHNENVEAEHKEHPLTEIVRFSIIAILIVIPIRMFIAQPFIVSGASMENTFHSGEYIIVDQISYYLHQPARGDVVIFRYPRDPSKFFIKRIIGVPGDKIDIANAVVTITNAEHPEGFIIDEPYIKSMAPTDALTETLGDREYFVMGDNRDNSSDSRAWGVLQEERIVGRAFLRLFPPSEFNYLPGSVTITEELTDPKTYIN
ncbi:signal peptidase I [Candidatus Kaiserbacteria bacterium]|nr:signal peptidase I [Candidatus Kaiserbacteria bacterium]USN88503.1 MAG: signal peptidase I [Candidatus Nomurabacteria bacterium]